MNTHQISKATESPKPSESRRIFLAGFLENISFAWKMGLMVLVLFLATLGISISAYAGMQSLRYQISNIYDFMLVPILAISNANTALADAQAHLENLDEITGQTLTADIEAIQADTQLANEIITRYDTEWVTTTSPDFTQALQQAGKLELQQQELASLKSFHTAFDAYQEATRKYLATLEAGRPDANLAQQVDKDIKTARGELQVLIDVNNEFADFSNTEAQAAFRHAILNGGIVLGIGLALGLFVSYLIVVSITNRLADLTRNAVAIQQGDLEQAVSVTGRDEVGLLGKAFNTMAEQLKGLFGTLEQRVAERTHSLELAADVGRSVSQVRALDEMLRDAAEIIRARFDLYYAQVYLTNSAQTELVLQSGTGEVGVQLVKRGHRLPLNTGSINGRAALEKHSVVISDTATSKTFRPNPLLPDTKSEMAVPLLVGDNVVGVLDLQSQKPGALNEDILPAFEALAGQLAIAIQNANLLAEAEQARAEVESQARRLVRKNWENYLDAIHTPEETGFIFEGKRVVPLADVADVYSPTEGNAIRAPISITGEAIGTLVVEMDAQALTPQKSELVTLVARQVAQHIENLRLLDNAERFRLEAEQAARRTTIEGWKQYMDSKTSESLAYLYDTKEVRPHTDVQPFNDSGLTLPIRAREETVGELAVQGIEPTDKEALDLAHAVAERLGAHIDSLRLFDQTQSALAQSERLFHASRRLTQAADLQDLVKVAVEALGIHEIDRVILGGLDYSSTGDLEGMTIIANWSNRSDLQATPIGTHYAKEALHAVSLFKSSEPLFFNDMLNDKRVDERTLAIAKRLNYRAAAALPLYIGSRQDALLLFEGEQPHSFTAEEIRLFSALAPQIATVVENRRQFEQTQKQAEREATLNAINQKIQSATTVEAVLQIAARELGHALGAPMTIAQLSMKDRSS